MFDLNDESIKSEGGSAIFNGGLAGVNIDCVLSEVKKDEASGAWDFFFTDKSGASIKLREWVTDTSRQDAEKKQKSQNTRLKHILTKFLPEGAGLPTGATDSASLLALVADTLSKTAHKTTPLKVKVVFKDNGYLTFTPYVPFMALASDEKACAGLKFSSSEITERPQPSNDAAIASAPAASTGGDVSWP
jgi:hypothetical protein